MKHWLSKNLIRIYAAAAIFYILLPILYPVVFPFNDADKRILSGRALRSRLG